MVRPNKSQIILLEDLRDFVINVMLDMEIWQDYDLQPLRRINLGLLRKNATRKHGVAKWPKGITIHELGVHNIEIIELHPELLVKKWSAYAAYVLHHEFIHALGFVKHDSLFRSIERAWPGREAAKLAPKFTEYLCKKSAKWLWVCSGCDTEIPRKKPSNGRYKCKKCLVVLNDIKL
tara:strand:- start:713 stop:1243 length:531 start_codon:yes stop_codon:yes gene_type:complete